MAKKGFFGRLAEAGKKWLESTFGLKSESTPTILEPQRKSASQLVEDQRKLAKKKNQDEIAQLRGKFEPIISEANRRIELLRSQGLQSMAIDRVYAEQGHEYFDIDSAESKGDIIAIATAARVFLNDEMSTLEGARIYTAQLRGEQYRGQFGNQWNKFSNNFKTYNAAVIDKDIAKVVFGNYRKIEELRASQITGDGAYGSENLIIAMYDAQIRGEDSFLVGMEQLDSYYRKKTQEWRSRFETANSVADILGIYESYDNDERGLYF